MERRALIQVEIQPGVWLDFMHVIGVKMFMALSDVQRKTKAKARIVSTDGRILYTGGKNA